MSLLTFLSPVFNSDSSWKEMGAVLLSTELYIFAKFRSTFPVLNSLYLVI